MKIRIKKWAGLLFLAAAVIGVLLFLRSPQVSNSLKRQLSNEFEAQTGYQLTADSLYLNLFPLYVGAKGVKVFDGEGGRLLAAREIKTYVGLSGLPRKAILVNRLSVKDPVVELKKPHVLHIASLAEKEEGKKPEGFRLEIKAIAVKNAAISYSDEKSAFGLEGFDAEAVLAARADLRASARRLTLAIPGAPRIEAALKGATLSLKGSRLDIKRLQFEVDGSKVAASGGYSPEGGVSLGTDAELLPETFKRLFNLKGQGKGRLSVKGKLGLADTPDILKTSLDLRVKGDFYLETLLELVGAHERLSGPVELDATVKGTVSDIVAGGKGSLKKGDIYGLSADRLDFKVDYASGLLSFKDIKGSLYGGKVLARFSLDIPGAENLVLRVDFSGVSTKGFMGFLKLDLPVPDGRLSGWLANPGGRFMPEGSFSHESVRPGGDFPGRIKSIRGDLGFAGDEAIRFSVLEIKTDATAIRARGLISPKTESLDMEVALKTADIRDLTMPEFSDVRGDGAFSGTLSGAFKDPVIAGDVSAREVFFKEARFGAVEGEVSYRMNLLTIKKLSARIDDEAFSMKGKVDFPQARELFSMKNPVYDLELSAKGARLENLMAIISPAAGKEASGIVSMDVRMKGAGPVYSGAVGVDNLAYGGYDVSRADMKFSYGDGVLAVSDGVLRKGDSSIKLKGSLGPGRRFGFSAGGAVRVREILPDEKRKKPLPVNARIVFESTGKGSLDEPEVEAGGRVEDVSFSGQSIQGGAFKAALKGKGLNADLSLLGRKLNIKGSATLAGALPWQAEIEIKNGRYDFLLAGFLKELPEDLLVNVQGAASLSGTKNSISGLFVLKHLNLAAYGQGFTLDKEARFELRDNALRIAELSLSGGHASFSVSGSAVLGRSVDFAVVGKSSLSPLKGFLGNVEMLTGNADFVFHIAGPWKDPGVNGGLSFAGANLRIKGMAQNLRILSAYAYVDEDKLVLEDFSGRIGGGEAKLKGVVYLKGFRPKRFYFDGLLNDINVSVQGLAATLGGNVAFRGDGKKQSLGGEVFIRRASYKKDVDWKALVLKKKAPPTAPKGFFAATELNLRVTGSENIRIDNNIARAPIEIDLTIRGTAANPIPLGRVEATGGKVYFRNTEFTIEHASAIFSDPHRVNPVLDILATSLIRGYRIRVSMSGTPERFNLAFASEPPLEEMKILALLTVGDFGGDVRGIEGGIGAAEATSFITGQVQEVFSERLRSIGGFDRFQVDPYVSKSTGTVTPRITVSKRLLGEQIYVVYSAPIGTDEQQVIKIEYALARNISLIGERDERGSLGGDVKFRFEFR